MKKIYLQLVLVMSSILLISCSTSTKSTDSAGTTGSVPTASSAPKSSSVFKPDTSKESQLNIPYRSLNTSKVVQQFGFASCNDQNRQQPLWKVITQHPLDLFVMMGDNVYASAKEDKPIIDQYIKLNKSEDYRKLREQVPFLAIWDDHDFGQNDGGETNTEKEEARRVFLNYWGYLKPTLPKDQKALYHSRIVGDKKKRVQFILLDTRWDRSDLYKNPDYNPNDPQQPQPPKIYLPHTDTQTRLLSDTQWQWLENELKKPAELRLLISSIQLIPNDHYFEKWGNFPHERERFFKLLQKHKIKNLVILSGDRHLASIAKTKNSTGDVFEITSSALNRPSRADRPEVDSSYTEPAFLGLNYGLATIDWDAHKVNFEIKDTQDKTQLSKTVSF